MSVTDDRHGRAARPDDDRRRRPPSGFRVRGARRFAEIAEEALDDLPDELLDALDDAELVVEDVPPVPDPDEIAALPDPYEPLLCDFSPATGGRAARVVVYRRPIELRAQDRADVEDLVRFAVGSRVADVLGLDVDLDDPWEE